jgi:hypothetical protein
MGERECTEHGKHEESKEEDQSEDRTERRVQSEDHRREHGDDATGRQVRYGRKHRDHNTKIARSYHIKRTAKIICTKKDRTQINENEKNK